MTNGQLTNDQRDQLKAHVIQMLKSGTCALSHDDTGVFPEIALRISDKSAHAYARALHNAIRVCIDVYMDSLPVQVVGIQHKTTPDPRLTCLDKLRHNVATERSFTRSASDALNAYDQVLFLIDAMTKELKENERCTSY